MSEPSLALQGAIYNTLRNDATLASLVNGRIYDTVPSASVFPYITIGEDQILDDGDSCGDAWQATATIHIWTRQPPGFPPAKSIAAAVRDALADELNISGFRIVSGLHRDSLNLRDPDGLTSHVVMTFEYLIDLVPA